METGSLGSPAALVDNKNPQALFLILVLRFVHPQVSSPLETDLPVCTLRSARPHSLEWRHPSTAQKMRDRKYRLASKGKGVSEFDFSQIKEELHLLLIK